MERLERDVLRRLEFPDPYRPAPQGLTRDARLPVARPWSNYPAATIPKEAEHRGLSMIVPSTSSSRKAGSRG